MQARWVKDGVNGEFSPIDRDSVTLELDAEAPPAGQAGRYRLEVWDGAAPASFTSHVWIEPGEGVVETGSVAPAGGGCALSAPRAARRMAPGVLLAALAALSLVVVRRFARKR